MIAIDTDGEIATIRLDRAATRNALGIEDWRALAAAIGTIGESRCRVLLLASAVAGTFCSGSDLTEIAGLRDDPDARPVFRAAMRLAMDALPRLAIPVIAVIEGSCYGAGVALALACDVRVAGAGARFGVPPAKLGISYPQADIVRLNAAVGRGQAARLLFGAGSIDAEEALRIGLVEVVAAGAREEAETMARAIAANALESLTLLKRQLWDAAPQPGSAFDPAFDAMFGGSAFAARIAGRGGRGQ